MNRLGSFVVFGIIVAVAGGFGAGYLLHPAAITSTRIVNQQVVLSGFGFSCTASAQPPYLEGVLQFNLTSTYWTPVLAEVAYVGDWTGDTDQSLAANGTKHVAVTWGPGMDQNIQVTQCPNVTVRVWRITQTLEACPSPPC
ncbi:MAG TPA: hypothetical protein VF992_08325 [Thermoplasmata archaeon]